MDIARLQQWVGKTQSASDQVTPHPISALAATLDLDLAAPVPSDPIPPLWHWLYFLEAYRQSELSDDGHAKRGGFFPPVSLPRRMWAGGRFQFHHPLRVGETYLRTSRVVEVREKKGRTGNLVFLTVRHEIGNVQGVALIEDQDLVYRDNARPGLPASDAPTAPADPRWERVIKPSDVLLFRYSALTFNSHRIHYDRRYETETEGYPGLVVHGPLVATLLLDLVYRHMPEAQFARFEFRAVSPLFDISPFKVCGEPEADGKTISLWAADANGGVAMTATATTP